MTKGRGEGRTPERVVELLKKKVAETSQSAVARATGLTQSAIHRYLKGIWEPSGETLQKMADYFGVSVGFLRGEYKDIDNAVSDFIDKISLNFEKRAISGNLMESGENTIDSLKSLDNFRKLLVDQYNISEEESKEMIIKYIGKILGTIENHFAQERLKIEQANKH